MGKGAAFSSDLLKGIFTGNNITNLANFNTGTANLYVALHTADPTAGNQNTSEVSYTGYNRVAVPRGANNWTANNNLIVNANAITFPTCSGGNANATYWSVGENNTGTPGEIYYTAALNNNGLSISNGITPSFGAGELTVSES